MKIRMFAVWFAWGLIPQLLAAAEGLVNLHEFAVTDGEISPNVIRGSDGNYYGSTHFGGSASSGTLYKLAVTGTLQSPSVTHTILHEFQDGSVTDDGWWPIGKLAEDGAGNFYGVAAY